MDVIARDHEQIAGWGVDANPKNDPTYPIKQRTDAEHAGYSWDRPEQQPATVEVLHSIERPDLTAVFGTSSPPSGLSGMIRRAAFTYSESSYAHWVPMILADRVNMVEGIVDDLAHGRIPNIPEELGWKAEWKHNRANFMGRMLVSGALAAAAVAYLRRRKGDREQQWERQQWEY
ncbi:MAG: hypothetical protein RLZZ387_4876 [Chloroflexota bacterium]|jgi:hypothetical protein